MNLELNRIYNEDCLEGMKRIPDNSVDCIICDLPYGSTACAWDSVIPFDGLWAQYRRVAKTNAPIVLFGSEPFSTKLRMSAFDLYKYDWIWVKNHASGFQHAKNMPMKDFENISIFSKGGVGHANLLGDKRMTYNPQGIQKCHIEYFNAKSKFGSTVGSRPSHKDHIVSEACNYPKTVLYFNKEPDCFHPTQKPVALIEYLIKTYSNRGGLILDNCMGSGTTAIACIRTHRNYIGFELDKDYYDKAQERIRLELAAPRLDFGEP